jgi:hypothetical protein
MTKRTTIVLFLALGGLVPLSAARLSATPQEGQTEEEVGPPTREELEAELMGQNPTQQEMLELFGKVERKLREIDDFLFEAAAGEGAYDSESSELSELFLATRDSSREVAEGIDRILELAEQMAQQQQQQQQSSSGSGGGQSSSDGQSPLDNRGREGQREQEQSSQEQREDLEGGQQPEPGNENAPGQGQPEDGAPNELPAEQRQGERGADSERGQGSDATGAGQWGELPPRMQEIFSNQVGDDLPLEYRDWIESYWRRLQREG